MSSSTAANLPTPTRLRDHNLILLQVFGRFRVDVGRDDVEPAEVKVNAVGARSPTTVPSRPGQST